MHQDKPTNKKCSSFLPKNKKNKKKIITQNKRHKENKKDKEIKKKTQDVHLRECIHISITYM